MSAVVTLCTDWRKIAEAPAARFNGVTRHLAPGEWLLEGATADVDLSAGKALADVDTIRVTDGDLVLFGGYVQPIAGTDLGGLTLNSSAAGERFSLTGPDMWAVPASRHAWPVPSTTPPWSSSHDTRTGVGSTVAAGFLDANLGTAALPDRQLAGLLIQDGLSGASGSWSARLQRLDELLVRVCADSGITCRPRVNIDGTVSVYLGTARDVSARVVLSDQGDLVDIVRRIRPRTVSHVLAGGQGQLTSRVFKEAGGGLGGARRETFIDRRNLAVESEVQTAAFTELATAESTVDVSAALAEAAAQRTDFRYLIDYDIGDTVSIEIDGVRYPTPVTSVTVAVGPEKTVVRPQFGSVTVDVLTGLLRTSENVQSDARSTID